MNASFAILVTTQSHIDHVYVYGDIIAILPLMRMEAGSYRLGRDNHTVTQHFLSLILFFLGK